jgi:ribonuclease Y
MQFLFIIIGFLAGAALAVGVYFYMKRKETSVQAAGQAEAERLLAAAQQRADRIRQDAQTEAREVEARAHAHEQEARQSKAEIQKAEQRLLKKEENIERKGEMLTAKELDLQAREKKLVQQEKELETAASDYEKLTARAVETIEKAAGMSAEEARRTLVAELISEAKLEAAKEIKAVEDEAREQAEQRAKQTIATAVGRYAGEFIAERTVSVVNIANEEMKGRIIGREGRNIRAFEAATGVDLIIDDTPEAITISAFSAVRREVARLSLEKLVGDGRIHPSRIEEIVKKTEAEVETLIKQAGERAAMELGIFGLHPDLIKLVGRLRYRTSYGQNVLAHSIEVAHLAGLLAAELGQNVKVTKRAGLLHDIGKAADQEHEGPHHIIGSQLAKKYGEAPQIVHSIRAHHEEPETILDHIVIASDALSGARPGARREQLEAYLQRLEDLEAIPKSFKGVEEAYAFQAGREVRVLVRPEAVNDAELSVLCTDIAKKIEQELTYPGRIKVAVIRQTRAEGFAK